MPTREEREEKDRLTLLRGTLDSLILRTLIFGRQHGQGIARSIQQTSKDELLVDHKVLYPALQRGGPELDPGRVGNIGQQPVLYLNEDRQKTTNQRNESMAEACKCYWACSRTGRSEGLKIMSRQRRMQADFSAEVEAHIVLEADQLRSEGMSKNDVKLGRYPASLCPRILYVQARIFRKPEVTSISILSADSGRT